MKLFNFFNKKKGNPFALSVSLEPYKKYMVKNISLLLEKKQVTTPDYISRFAAHFLKTGTVLPLTETDLYKDVDIKYARKCLNRYTLICSLRFSNIDSISKQRRAETEFITLKVSRKGNGCTKEVIEKRYKPDSDIPIYPCTDCECTPMCDIWYKPEF